MGQCHCRLSGAASARVAPEEESAEGRRDAKIIFLRSLSLTKDDVNSGVATFFFFLVGGGGSG